PRLGHRLLDTLVADRAFLGQERVACGRRDALGAKRLREAVLEHAAIARTAGHADDEHVAQGRLRELRVAPGIAEDGGAAALRDQRQEGETGEYYAPHHLKRASARRLIAPVSSAAPPDRADP